MSDYPQFFARFYDVIYKQIRSQVDEKFFFEEIDKADGPILEIGSGTGRYFSLALEKKKDIYGIDISQEMINILLKKISPREHFRISCQNMIDFSFKHKFDLIIAPFRVFMHLIDVESQMLALDNIFRHMTVGSRFIFDLYVPDLNILQNGLDEVVDFEGEYMPGRKIRRITSSNSDMINQVNNITMRFEWEEENGTPMKKEWHFQMRFFFRYELEHLLARSPFNKYRIFGDYNLNPLNERSKDFVVICEK